MKIIFPLLYLFFCPYTCFSQNNYPEPVKTSTRLFYIQHSNNHNTYVYDANIKGGVIDSSQPINQYEIVYTEKGIKRPLSTLQRKFAYGMILQESQPNLFKFRLAASNKLYFYLNNNEDTEPRIFVTVNKRKMYLDKMFVKLKYGFLGLKPKAEYVLFYGKDYSSGKSITEKVTME